MKPFSPSPASTVNIDVSASSQRVAVPACIGGTVRIMNNGTATVFIAFGDGTVTATTTAGIPIGPGVIEVMTVPLVSGPLNIAAIASGSTGRIYFSAGEGI